MRLSDLQIQHCDSVFGWEKVRPDPAPSVFPLSLLPQRLGLSEGASQEVAAGGKLEAAGLAGVEPPCWHLSLPGGRPSASPVASARTQAATQRK